MDFDEQRDFEEERANERLAFEDASNAELIAALADAPEEQRARYQRELEARGFEFTDEEDVPVTPTRVYFAVPEHYGIGLPFATYAEAEAHARSTIEPLGLADHNHGIEQFSRAYVDVRLVDSQGDRPLHRIEVRS
jgi:hypothetical protein